MTLAYFAGRQITGTATDRTGGSWTNLPAGWRFLETDTLLEYYWNGTAWTATRADPDAPYSYYIYKSGANWNAKAGVLNPAAISANSDAATVIQSAVTNTLALARGGNILFDPTNAIIMQNYIDIPTSAGPKPLGLWSAAGANTDRDKGVVFEIGTSFPTNRFVFETSGATDLSQKYAIIDWRNMGAYNPNFTTINAGLLKLDFDVDAITRHREVYVNGFMCEYMKTPLLLVGGVWTNVFENLYFRAANASFSGDYDIKLEQGSHTSVGANPWPKMNNFKNIQVIRGGGATVVASLLCDAGGYNNFENYIVDGWTNSNSIWKFTNKSTFNSLRNITAIDMTGSTPTASILFDGAGVYNNIVSLARIPAYAANIGFANGAYRNEVELAGYWGGNVSINNIGTGDYNLVTIFSDGQATAATAPVKPTLSGNATENAKIRIIDRRKGAYNSGTAATITSGGTTVAVTHNLFTTPNTVRLSPTSDTLGKRWWVSAKAATTFTISIDSSGASNILFDWEADVY